MEFSKHYFSLDSVMVIQLGLFCVKELCNACQPLSKMVIFPKVWCRVWDWCWKTLPQITHYPYLVVFCWAFRWFLVQGVATGLDPEWLRWGLSSRTDCHQTPSEHMVGLSFGPFQQGWCVGDAGGKFLKSRKKRSCWRKIKWKWN